MSAERTAQWCRPGRTTHRACRKIHREDSIPLPRSNATSAAQINEHFFVGVSRPSSGRRWNGPRGGSLIHPTPPVQKIHTRPACQSLDSSTSVTPDIHASSNGVVPASPMQRRLHRARPAVLLVAVPTVQRWRRSTESPRTARAGGRIGCTSARPARGPLQRGPLGVSVSVMVVVAGTSRRLAAVRTFGHLAGHPRCGLWVEPGRAYYFGAGSARDERGQGLLALLLATKRPICRSLRERRDRTRDLA